MKQRRYKYIAKKVNGKRIDEHRLVMERHLGRKLQSWEVVHHVDGNPGNNMLANLRVMSRSKHSGFHRRGYNPGIATRELLRESGRKNRPAAKLQIEDVRNIKRMLGDKVKQWLIAWIYRVHPETVSEIKRGIRWAWIDE